MVVISLIKKNYKNIDNSLKPIFFGSFFVVLFYFWPIKSSGSFFSTFTGTFFWLNLGIIFLISKKNRIPNDYMKSQLRGLDKYKGNIDMISNKISNVRTWSYVANKKNWVENSDYWIQMSKNIEDSLSDKLHTELTKSFIDKRISVLSRGLKPVSYTHLTLPTTPYV